MQVTLRKGENSEASNLSRFSTAPRTVLILSCDQIALITITFLVAKEEIDCEEFQTGRPVLENLLVDTNTFLDRNISVLDGADCSDIDNPTV